MLANGMQMETVQEHVVSEYDDGMLRPIAPSPSPSPSSGMSEEEDMTIQASSESPSPSTVTPEAEDEEGRHEHQPEADVATPQPEDEGDNETEVHDGSSDESHSPSISLAGSDEDTGPTSPESGLESSAASAVNIQRQSVRISLDVALPRLPQQEEHDLISPVSDAPTDTDASTWEGNHRIQSIRSLEDKLINGDLPSIPQSTDEEGVLPLDWTLSHDYAPEDVAYNSEGNLVGATLSALVEKMTPHDSIVDATFAGIFFMTFRQFSTPVELVQILVARFNLEQPTGLSDDDLDVWRHRKLIPVRLRVSNFIKLWLETYWRGSNDDAALPLLLDFVRGAMSDTFIAAAQRLEDLINVRLLATQTSSPVSERHKMGDRLTVNMSLNMPFMPPTGETPRPVMTKTLLTNLRSKNFAGITVTDFDALELARQLTIMECSLYCAVTPEEMLDIGQHAAPPAVNVKAVSSLSTVITGWVAECILDEHDIKKRTTLVKFFIKLADVSILSTVRLIINILIIVVVSVVRHSTTSVLPELY